MIKIVSAIFIAVREKVDKINPIFLAVTLFMVFLLLPLATYNRTTAGGDMAEYINNPLRVINGELPYRDFWLLFPPGEVFLPALIYRVFGLNINILLISCVVLSAFAGLFSFLLGRAIFKDNFFATIVAILVFFNGTTGRYFLLLLISALLFMKYFKNNGAMELFLTGIFIGLAFLFKLYVVGAAFLAFFLTIFIQSKFDAKPFSHSVKHVAILCVGVLLVLGIASLALMDIWQCMVKEIVIESVSHGTSMNLPYFIDSIRYLKLVLIYLKRVWEIGGFFYMVQFFLHLAKFINVTLSYLLPFLLVGISIWYLVGKKLEKSAKVIVLFFLLWGMFTFPKALGRSDIYHLAPSITPLFFLLIFLLQKSIEKVGESETYVGKFITYGSIVITFSLLVPVLLFPVQTVFVLMKPHYEVSTEYGTLLFESESEAIAVNNVISFINKNTDEGDYIFVTPWFAPPFYALTNRKNPTYYDSMIDLIARPSDEKQKRVCNDILNKDTKLIIHYAYWGFDSKPGLQFLNTCPILQRCIEDNFELVEKYGHYWIYVPKKKLKHFYP